MVPSAFGADSRQATTAPFRGPIGLLSMADTIATTPAVFTIAPPSIKAILSIWWCTDSSHGDRSTRRPTGFFIRLRSNRPIARCQAECSHEKAFHAPNVRRLSFCVSSPRARRARPDRRPGGEDASVVATAQTHATTKDADAADPQGRGSQNRGDQEQSFASANAENEATPGYPQRKRAPVAENS